MLRNNIELDVKIKCIEQNKPQSKIAEEIGTSAPYVSRIVNSGDKVLNKTFVQIMESLMIRISLKHPALFGRYPFQATYFSFGMVEMFGYFPGPHPPVAR